MKILVLFIVFAVVACADPTDHHHEHHDYKVKTRDDLLRYRDECVSHLNIPDDLLAKYKNWEYPDDEKSHCYMKCVFEKFGLFDEHHGFDVHKIHHQLVGDGKTVDHSNDIHKKIESCADKNTEGSDTCTWAYRGGLCFIKENLRLVQSSVKKD